MKLFIHLLKRKKEQLKVIRIHIKNLITKINCFKNYLNISFLLFQKNYTYNNNGVNFYLIALKYLQNIDLNINS
jgi:hypothetical protein